MGKSSAIALVVSAGTICLAAALWPVGGGTNPETVSNSETRQRVAEPRAKLTHADLEVLRGRELPPQAPNDAERRRRLMQLMLLEGIGARPYGMFR